MDNTNLNDSLNFYKQHHKEYSKYNLNLECFLSFDCFGDNITDEEYKTLADSCVSAYLKSEEVSLINISDFIGSHYFNNDITLKQITHASNYEILTAVSNNNCGSITNNHTTIDFKAGNFASDYEKMQDFVMMNKQEFLNSYSYLTESEYDNTATLFTQGRVRFNDDILCEYDEAGREIHFKNICNGYEQWHEYDEAGNITHYTDSDGLEKWHEYDEAGNEIHYKTNDGYETWYEYDEAGNETYYKNNSNGREEWYDSDGNKIDKPLEHKAVSEVFETAKSEAKERNTKSERSERTTDGRDDR